MQETTVDIAIVGGGPAGLSAGVWAARYMHSVTIVDSGDPRNAETLRINGFLGLDPVTPHELRARPRDVPAAWRRVGRWHRSAHGEARRRRVLALPRGWRPRMVATPA